VEAITIAVGAVILLVGGALGYFVGYRSGAVAGELASLKEHRTASRRRKSKDELGED
jgi:hypothetical protein